jgi:FAD/FMN-containing dehydrogenase
MVSPLAVLKNFGEASSGLLSFPRPGITLAMDLPVSAESAQLISRLYDLVIDYGGRVYLAKDALLSPSQFRAMYPELDAFREVLCKVDPDAQIQSDLSRRLQIHG